MLSFLSLLSMQIGSLVLATSIIIIGLCTILTNLLRLNWNTILPWTIIMIFSTILMLVWSTVFVGTYKTSFRLLRNAKIMWSICICVWMLLILCSVFPIVVKYICLEARCPETMWMIPSPRSDVNNDDNDESYNKSQCNELQLCRLTDITKHHSLQTTIITSVIMLSVYLGIYTYAWIYLYHYTKSIRLQNENTKEFINLHDIKQLNT